MHETISIKKFAFLIISLWTRETSVFGHFSHSVRSLILFFPEQYADVRKPLLLKDSDISPFVISANVMVSKAYPVKNQSSVFTTLSSNVHNFMKDVLVRKRQNMCTK